MSSPIRREHSPIAEDVQLFWDIYLNGKTPDLEKTINNIKNIACHIEFLTKEDLLCIDSKALCCIFEKAIEKEHGITEKIKKLLPPNIFAKLLEKNPNNQDLIDLTLEFKEEKLQLHYNHYLSDNQLEDLFSHYKDELAKIENLDLSHSEKLQNLALLKYFPKLKKLHLNHCLALKNLKGIEAVSSTLTELSLKHCANLPNLDNLETCQNLRLLDAAECNRLEKLGSIEKTSGLLGLTMLKELSLANCNFILRNNFTILSNLTSLESLNLQNLPLITNVHFLTKLTKLTELHLCGTSVQEIPPALKEDPFSEIKKI